MYRAFDVTNPAVLQISGQAYRPDAFGLVTESRRRRSVGYPSRSFRRI